MKIRLRDIKVVKSSSPFLRFFSNTTKSHDLITFNTEKEAAATHLTAGPQADFVPPENFV